MVRAGPAGKDGAPISAILCVFGAYFAFTCMDTAAKYLVLSGMQPTFVAWTRYIGHFCFVAAMLRLPLNPHHFRVSNLRIQVLRSVIMVISGIAAYASLATIQLVDLIAIVFAAPLVTPVLAGMILGERLEWRRWVAVTVGFLGVLVVTRPGLGVFGIGHVYGMVAMITHCLFVILTRKLSLTESQESLMLIPGLIGTILLLPVVPIIGTMPRDPVQWIVMLSLGSISVLGMFLMIKACKVVEASILAPYSYLQMLWTVCLGYLVFNQLPDLWTVVGAAIIACSGIYLMQRDRQLRLAYRGRQARERQTG